MKQLEDSYKDLQSTKKAKMLQVVNACRKLQRYYRLYRARKENRSAYLIQ